MQPSTDRPLSPNLNRLAHEARRQLAELERIAAVTAERERKAAVAAAAAAAALKPAQCPRHSAEFRRRCAVAWGDSLFNAFAFGDIKCPCNEAASELEGALRGLRNFCVGRPEASSLLDAAADTCSHPELRWSALVKLSAGVVDGRGQHSSVGAGLGALYNSIGAEAPGIRGAIADLRAIAAFGKPRGISEALAPILDRLVMVRDCLDIVKAGAFSTIDPAKPLSEALLLLSACSFAAGQSQATAQRCIENLRLFVAPEAELLARIVSAAGRPSLPRLIER